MPSLPVESNVIDWADIKRVLKPCMKIDVQFIESETPLPYVVVMLLDEQVIFCRAQQVVDLSDLDGMRTATVFIPTSRDLCLFRVAVRGISEDGMYLALSPTANAEFLRRRRSIRVKTKDDISYRVQFAGKSNIYKGIAVQDISRGGIGLLVYAAGPIRERAHADIHITFPGSADQVRAQGIVSHCAPLHNMPRTYRVGIQFSRISPTDQQTIAMYIDRALKGANPGR